MLVTCEIQFIYKTFDFKPSLDLLVQTFAHSYSKYSLIPKFVVFLNASKTILIVKFPLVLSF